MKYLIVSALLTFYSFQLFAAGDDPYAAIEQIKLDNGLTVYLAPSDEATLLDIRVEVDVGTEAEDPSNWGVSHLLEHVLFRDKQLRDEMTYLQVIKEAGGSANGGTEERITSYIGSIPAKKGPWLLDNFAKMLIDPVILDDYVDKEKGTVELERGRPGPITEILGFNPMDYLYPHYLEEKTFWESNFQLPKKQHYTISQEQMATRRLTTAKVKQHYQDYYYPSNMRLFIAGKFDRNEIMQKIKGPWAGMPPRNGKKIAAEVLPNGTDNPYIDRKLTEETPYVYFGSKILNGTLKDREIVASYVEYLAHRLMKEIRNKKGQTYSANGTTVLFYKNGYAVVGFQTPKEKFSENLDIIRNYMANEATAGKLTPDQVKEALELHLSEYKLMGKESGTMMKIAQDTFKLKREFDEPTSPYALLSSTTPEEYNSSLAKHFKPNLRYEVTYAPPLLFPYDYILMSILVSIYIFLTMQKYLTKTFHHDKIRWVRKVRFPPLKILEFFALTFGCYLSQHMIWISYYLRDKTPLLLVHSVGMQYVNTIIYIFWVLACCQGTLSLIPRKLMVMEHFLVIKSISYFSRKIPLTEIQSVSSTRYLSKALPFYRWLLDFKIKCFNYRLRFWKPGVLITLKNGRAPAPSASAT